MKHRLIIVEGIMGSGKSTTMRHLAARIANAGVPVQAFHERSDPHPVRATDDLEHWFKPWLDVSAPELSGHAIGKWRNFVDAAMRTDSIFIFDGQLFHGDFTNLFMMEADMQLMKNHIRYMETTIKPLEPLVVYFYQTDVEKAIKKIVTERGAEWEQYQTSWKLQSPYAQRRALEGADGLARMYIDYRRATDSLYDTLDVAKLQVENSGGDWQEYYGQLDAMLGLPD